MESSQWTSGGAAEPLWSLEVGKGYSCPSIMDGRLVTTGHVPEDGQDIVVCHDALTGEEYWWFAYDAVDTPRYHSGGTLTTPSIHDGVVYVANREGKVHALDLEEGMVLWKRDYRTELDLTPSFHGYCASPVVLEDSILLVLGGTAVLVERDGGAVRWRTENHGGSAFTNPTVFELRGKSVSSVMLGQTLFVLDLEDGSVVHELPWELQGNAVHVAPPVVVEGDRLFLSTAYNKGAGMFQLGDEREPELLWASRRMRNKVTGCFLHGEHLYGFDESMLKCIGLDGEEAWRVRGLGMGALSIAGDRLLVLTSSGELIVAEASPDEYRELSRKQVLEGGVYWTMPVLVDGLIYVRNSEGQLACFDHRPGTGAVGGGSAGPEQAAPEPKALFESHARQAGAEALVGRTGLRIEGQWEIRGRGMAPTPMTLTLAGPDRWEVALESRDLVQAFDGTRGWHMDPRGNTLLKGDLLEEAPYLFPLQGTLAPSAPEGAVVEPEARRFGETLCWVVVSSGPAEPGGKARRFHHYFDVETGRLAGREAEGFAALAFEGTLDLDGVRLPSVVRIYRADDGQEEALYLESGTWFEVGEDFLTPPPEIELLLLSPEELAVVEAGLRERFARELGRYRVDVEEIPDEEMELAVEGGRVVVRMGPALPLDLNSVEDGFYTIEGTGGAAIAFERTEGGEVTAVKLRMEPGVPEFILPRIDE